MDRVDKMDTMDRIKARGHFVLASLLSTMSIVSILSTLSIAVD
jgi:hypothetical protein